MTAVFLVQCTYNKPSKNRLLRDCSEIYVQELKYPHFNVGKGLFCL